ncbi:unnamed protein product [Orchesella dallaii]|uniref:Uncharacterized protein n=1 Tax=Orchesella dallaii TaxID=48710 RepID=A0ABP1S8L3_9HEXA
MIQVEGSAHSSVSEILRSPNFDVLLRLIQAGTLGKNSQAPDDICENASSSTTTRKAYPCEDEHSVNQRIEAREAVVTGNVRSGVKKEEQENSSIVESMMTARDANSENECVDSDGPANVSKVIVVDLVDSSDPKNDSPVLSETKKKKDEQSQSTHFVKAVVTVSEIPNNNEQEKEKGVHGKTNKDTDKASVGDNLFKTDCLESVLEASKEKLTGHIKSGACSFKRKSKFHSEILKDNDLKLLHFQSRE